MSPPGPGTVRSRTSAAAGPAPQSRSVSIRWVIRASSIGISWAGGPGAASMPARTASIFGSSTRRRLWRHALLMQGGLRGDDPRARDRVGRCGLVDQDALDDADGLRVAGPARHPQQLLVTADLQVLEGVGERGELAGRVRVGVEEHAPVEAAEPHGRVLEPRRAVAVRLQARAHRVRVAAGLL